MPRWLEQRAPGERPRLVLPSLTDTWSIKPVNVAVFMLSAPPAAGSMDEAIVARLQGLGCAATPVAGTNDASFAAGVVDKQLAVITASASTNTYGDAARVYTKPIMLLRHQAWSTPGGFCSATGLSTFTSDSLEVLLPADGLVQVFGASAQISRATIWESGKQIIARANGMANHGSVVRFDQGAPIASAVNGGVCAGKRWLNGLGLSTPANMLERAWAFFDEGVSFLTS